ncbi:WXG100 family type VII secretion target [Streptomyces sp. NPDC094468]|uniref:WXG100 family type VII secretion target n=1 Tax=Streptomyces sp. NPDC094468 TaxID=3366066 RepID=UPI00380FD97F
MAEDEFHVDTEGLHRQLPYVQQLAARFRDVGANLEGLLSELGDCWGDDAAGAQFLEQYATPRTQIIDSTGQMGDLVDSMHDGIRTMAGGLDRLEDQNVEEARNLHTPQSDPANLSTRVTQPRIGVLGWHHTG